MGGFAGVSREHVESNGSDGQDARDERESALSSSRAKAHLSSPAHASPCPVQLARPLLLFSSIQSVHSALVRPTARGHPVERAGGVKIRRGLGWSSRGAAGRRWTVRVFVRCVLAWRQQQQTKAHCEIDDGRGRKGREASAKLDHDRPLPLSLHTALRAPTTRSLHSIAHQHPLRLCPAPACPVDTRQRTALAPSRPPRLALLTRPGQSLREGSTWSNDERRIWRLMKGGPRPRLARLPTSACPAQHILVQRQLNCFAGSAHTHQCAARIARSLAPFVTLPLLDVLGTTETLHKPTINSYRNLQNRHKRE